MLGVRPSEELTISISISFLGQRSVDAEMGQETKGGFAYKHDAKRILKSPQRSSACCHS